MKNFVIILILLLALTGLVSILYANRDAVGVGPDSAIYIASAQSLLDGDGLSTPTGIDGPIPMTHYAPLYPALLGFAGITGIDLNTIARGLNAILFFLILLLAGLVVLQSSPGFWPLAPSVALFLLVSEDLLTIHSYAWSESLFIFLCMLGCMLFSHYLWKPTSRKLIASIGLLSLAFLTRYAGVAIVPMVFFGTILFYPENLRKRTFRAIWISISCSIPAFLWFIRNLVVAGNVSDRKLLYHPLAPHDVRNALDTVSNWFLPGRITGNLRDILTIMFVVLTIILIGFGLLTNARRAKEKGERDLGQILAAIFALFGIFYFLLLLFTILYMDAQTTFDYRLLSPLLISGTILFFAILPGYLKKIAWPVQLALGLLFLLVVGFNAVHSLKFVAKAHEGSFKMYAGKGWQDATIIQRVRALPTGVPIYSNGDDAIIYVLGRPAARFPEKLDPFSLEENPDYREEMAQMQEILQDRDGFIVCFSGMTWRGYLPDCESLEAQLPLETRWAGDEGWIYTIGSD